MNFHVSTLLLWTLKDNDCNYFVQATKKNIEINWLSGRMTVVVKFK